MAPPIQISTATAHLVAIPYPGRGHMNPMINLSEFLLSSSPVTGATQLTITIIVTEEWLGFLTEAGQNHYHPSIRFRSIPNVIPSEHDRGSNIIHFRQAVMTKMETPVDRLMSQLEPQPSAILADTFLAWPVNIGDRRGIPVYSLFPMSPSVFSVLFHFDQLKHLTADKEEEEEEEEEGSEILPVVNSLKLSYFDAIFKAKDLEFALTAFSEVRKVKGLIFNTVEELEAPVINNLKELLPFPVYTIGPCIPFMKLKNINNQDVPPYLSWLDCQSPSSVLYVSLGSFFPVPVTQINELALGLRDSGVRFLWVARAEAARVNVLISDNRDTGLVVPWCDQLKVLTHPAVGGFLTHCGWNSTLEGVYAGKPMITFPLCWDQPPDSGLIADVWKIGVEVKKGLTYSEGSMKSFVGKEDVANVVRMVMDLDGEQSKAMRRKVRFLMEKCHSAIQEGGTTRTSIHEFLNVLAQQKGNVNFQ